MSSSAHPLGAAPLSVIVAQDKLTAMLVVDKAEKYSFTAEDVIRLLQEHGVTYGYRRDEIEALVSAPRPGVFTVAQHTPPKPPENEWVEIKFAEKTSGRLKEKEEGEVLDFRETFSVPSVEPGTLLAVKHPAVPGVEGVNVLGQPIPPPPPLQVELRAGKGAVLSPDGSEVYSAISGRPWSQTRGRTVVVGVDAEYRHDGDVDIKTGNVRFKGDVVISGNICENMEVDVTGRLVVHGYISRAIVRAGRGLDVKKVITASKVKVGENHPILFKIQKLLEDFQFQLKNLNSVATKLLASDRFKDGRFSFGQLVVALLDNKFTELRRQVQSIEKNFKMVSDLPEELSTVQKEIECLKGLNPLKLETLDPLIESVDAALHYLQVVGKDRADARLDSVWNSIVEATGSVFVTGQGCFNSRIISRGRVVINGVFRGGEIYAREGIEAGQIGGPTGVKTMVRVDEGSRIKAGVIYNGTTIQVGRRCQTLKSDMSNVLAYLDSEGELKISLK